MIDALDKYSAATSDLEMSLGAVKGQLVGAQAEASEAARQKGDVYRKIADTQTKQADEITQFAKDNPYPHPDIKPWTQKPPEANPLQDFGSWASAFGIVASMFTKTPLQNALNASAAAIRAQQQGRWDQYDEAKKVWKENTEAAIKNADWEAKSYQAAWDLMKTNQAAGMAVLQTSLAAADNKVALAQLKAGNLDKVWEMTKGVADFAAQGPQRMLSLEKLDLEIQDARKVRDLYEQWEQRHPDAPPEEKARMRQSMTMPVTSALVAAQNKWTAYHDPKTNKDFLMNGAGEARLLDGSPYVPQAIAHPRSGSARSAPALAMQEFVDEKQRTEGRDPTSQEMAKFAAEFSAQQKALGQFMPGSPQGARIVALNTAVNHMETLRKLGAALQNGDIQAFNKLSQDWAEATGSDVPTNFDSAVGVVGKEIVKSIVNAGGSLAERAQAEGQISRIKSPNQINGALQTISELLGGQMQSLQRAYVTSTKEDNFADYLSPAAKKAMGFKEKLEDYDQGEKPPQGAPADAKKAPDGHWYTQDPDTKKYLDWGTGK